MDRAFARPEVGSTIAAGLTSNDAGPAIRPDSRTHGCKAQDVAWQVANTGMVIDVPWQVQEQAWTLC